METENQELKKEFEALYQFCKQNKEAIDRLNRIYYLVEEITKLKEKEMFDDEVKFLDELSKYVCDEEPTLGDIIIEIQERLLNLKERRKKI